MIDHQKIGIIGAGHVGSHVGCALLAQGLCRELVLLDTDRKKAVAQADDLQDMVGFAPLQARVRAGDYGDLGDAGIVVVCASGPICKEDRLEELAESVRVMDEIIPGLKKSGFDGVLLVITNPVDVVARYLAVRLGMPWGRVIGSGTTLDTARLVRELSRRTGVAQHSIQGMVLGEHGESQVPCWSQVTAGGVPVRRLMETDLIIRGVQGDEGRILPVSVPVDGSDGGVFASLPCRLGKNGVEQVFRPDLAPEEEERFRASCARMEEFWRTIPGV